MFTLYIGRSHTPVVVNDRGCRTQAQFETVKALLPQVDFVCNNVFEGENPHSDYKCSFAFVCYDLAGKLTLKNITPTGRVTRTVTA